MQFYIIHNDPKINASLLPDYALKKVNLREGWQILSDIGHKFNVTWEGQYAKYNPYHVLTKSFWMNKEAFDKFIFHYTYCLKEYRNRYDKETIWHKLFKFFGKDNYCILYDKISNGDIISQNLEYLLTEKRKFLTEDEMERLKKFI